MGPPMLLLTEEMRRAGSRGRPHCRVQRLESTAAPSRLDTGPLPARVRHGSIERDQRVLKKKKKKDVISYLEQTWIRRRIFFLSYKQTLHNKTKRPHQLKRALHSLDARLSVIFAARTRTKKPDFQPGDKNHHTQDANKKKKNEKREARQKKETTNRKDEHGNDIPLRHLLPAPRRRRLCAQARAAQRRAAPSLLQPGARLGHAQHDQAVPVRAAVRGEAARDYRRLRGGRPAGAAGHSGRRADCAQLDPARAAVLDALGRQGCVLGVGCCAGGLGVAAWV